MHKTFDKTHRISGHRFKVRSAAAVNNITVAGYGQRRKTTYGSSERSRYGSATQITPRSARRLGKARECYVKFNSPETRRGPGTAAIVDPSMLRHAVYLCIKCTIIL